MNKLALAAVLAIPLLTGCSLKTRSIPDSGIVYAHADYTVLGATSAEACGTYILGIDWGHLFKDQQGSATMGASSNPLSAIMGLISGGGGAEEGRALYDALAKMPEATNLYAPRTESKASGLLLMGKPIFGKRCAKVEGRGVKIGAGPVPNAN